MASGVCFDMDGTLVDSEPIWHRTIIETAAEAGVRWTMDDCLASVGAPMERWIGDLQGRGMPGGLAEIRALVAGRVAAQVADDVPWLPGAYALLEALAEARVPTALVTNAARVNADALVRAAPAGALEVVVTSDDVTDAKPHPEPYLTAARLLDVDPERSIGVEDSAPGALAARAAGMAVWFVRSHSPHPGFGPDRSVASLAEVSVDDVLRTLERR